MIGAASVDVNVVLGMAGMFFYVSESDITVCSKSVSEK